MNTSHRIFLGALVHETNTFSPLPTTLASFAQGGLLHHAGDAGTFERARQTDGYGDALAAFTKAGDELVAGPCAWAMPSGLVGRHAYETLRDELLDTLSGAGTIDAVFLFLHGAMMADGYADCEGDLLARVRQLLGPAMPIGVLLDLHGNVSQAMVDSGAVFVACKEYPHTDYPARVVELRAMLSDMIDGAPWPVTLLRKVPMVAPLGTTEKPMSDFVRRLAASEGDGGILSVSAMHGFAWSDTPDMGAAILIVHAGGDQAAAARARALAQTLATELFAIRASGMHKYLPLDAAIAQALALSGKGGPVVMADSSDNPGGGAACDSTFVLRALLERGIDRVAFGMLWDPQAVQIAAAAGVGARLALRIGGKVGPQSGDPLDVMAEVMAVQQDPYQIGVGGQGREPMGLSVAIRVAGIEIVLNSIRQQMFSPNPFSDLGIDLASKRIVVVKSSQHFRTGFDPIASATVYCNAPGSINLDFASLPYAHVRRPIWPLDDLTSANLTEDSQ